MSTQTTNYGFLKPDITDNADLTIFIGQNMDKIDTEFVNSKVWRSVKEDGAVGDEVNDDAPSIQNSMNNYSHIYVPSGNYRLNASLTIKANTHLRLHPSARLVRYHNDIVITNYDATSTGYNGIGNFIIEGGTLDVNGDAYPDVANGISMSHAHDVIIRDLTIKDTPAGHAIEVTGSYNVLIEHIKFLGYRIDDSGANTYVEAIQIEPTLPPPSGATYTYPYITDSTPTKNVTVQKCYFGPSDNYPTHPCSVGNHGVKYGLWYDQIRILDNVIDGASYWGIRPFKFRDSIISRNLIINGSGGGIYCVVPNGGASIQDINNVTQVPQGTDSIIITDNIIDNMSGSGIYVAGGDANSKISQLIIKGNVIKNVGNYGMQTDYIDKSIIAENTLESVTNRAFSMTNATNSIFENNILHSGNSNAVFMQTSQYVKFNSNQFDTFRYYGFNISGDNKDIELVGNLIKNPSQNSNGGYDGIIISSGADNMRIVNNKVRQTSGNFQPRYGLNIQTGTTNITRFGNDFKCNAVTASVTDLSTSGNTGTADII